MGVKVFIRNTGNEERDKNELIRNMRKFKKMCEKEGVVKEMRKHEFYEKPSVVEKRKRHRRDMTILRAQLEAEERFTKNVPDEF